MTTITQNNKGHIFVDGEMIKFGKGKTAAEYEKIRIAKKMAMIAKFRKMKVVKV